MNKFNIEDMIGIPYSKMNCIEFVWYVYKKIHNKEMKLFFNPKDFKDNLNERLRLFKEHQHLAKYLEQPKEDCLVFMSNLNENNIHHIGYYKNGLVYHSIEDLGVVAQKMEDLNYKIVQFVEYKQ